MNNGSMFADLEKFKDEDFWREHKTIAFNTLTEKNEYEILAVFKTVVYTDSPEAFKYYRFTDAQSPEEFDAYIEKCKELSLYDAGVSAEYGDKLITLSTCEYSRTNGRLVVVAKKVTESSGANAPANDGAAEISDSEHGFHFSQKMENGGREGNREAAGIPQKRICRLTIWRD